MLPGALRDDVEGDGPSTWRSEQCHWEDGLVLEDVEEAEIFGVSGQIDQPGHCRVRFLVVHGHILGPGSLKERREEARGPSSRHVCVPVAVDPPQAPEGHDFRFCVNVELTVQAPQVDALAEVRYPVSPECGRHEVCGVLERDLLLIA